MKYSRRETRPHSEPFSCACSAFNTSAAKYILRAVYSTRWSEGDVVQMARDVTTSRPVRKWPENISTNCKLAVRATLTPYVTGSSTSVVTLPGSKPDVRSNFLQDRQIELFVYKSWPCCVVCGP